jgi:hypothetical protein
LFARAISARTLQLSKNTSRKARFPLQDKPVFKALLGVPWKCLAESSSIDEATRLLIPFAPVLEAYSPVDDARGFGLRWKTSCPCCLDEIRRFPNRKLDLPKEEFAKLRLEVTKKSVILRDCTVLDESTGH